MRASDSRTCDVLLNASGGLGNTASCSNAGDNGTAVATWCNATTCTIDILYDQTGNARHALANSSTNRATLTFNCVNVNRPCADFGANVAYYNASTFPDTAQPVTVSFVAIRTGNTAAQNTILGRGAAPAFFSASPNTVGAYYGTLATATANDNAWHSVQIVANGASSVISVNGTQNTGKNVGATSTGANMWIGSNSSAAGTFTGQLTELVAWSGAFGASALTSQCNNEYLYWGTSVAC